MVYSSIGVFSFCGQHATDNAIVVLFFVISLIGINRIFHTVRTFQTNGHCYGQTDISDREMNNRITATIRKSIPIVFTNSLICSTCFFLAGGVPPYISVNMPAVEVFSRHAGLAILFDTAFYLLVILPLFQYDARREMVSRAIGSTSRITFYRLEDVKSGHGLSFQTTRKQDFRSKQQKEQSVVLLIGLSWLLLLFSWANRTGL